MIKNQTDNINSQVNEWTKTRWIPAEKLTVEGVTFEKVGEGKDTLYPYNNEENKTIEYRDQYGNLKATRKYDIDNVGQYNVQEGEEYYVLSYGLVKVLKVWEEPKFLWTTERLAKVYCYKTNKEETIQLDKLTQRGGIHKLTYSNLMEK